METENKTPTPKTRSSKGRRWTMLVALVIAAVFLYLAFKDVDWVVMGETVRKGRYEFLIIVFLISSFNLFLRANRWRILLTVEKPISVFTVFSSNNLGYLANNFLPARAGEFIRSAVVGRTGGIGTSYALATALTERITDAVLLVLISLTAIFSLSNLPSVLVTATRTMAIGGLIGLVGILMAPRMEKQINWVLDRLPIPEKFRAPINGFLQRFLMGMRALQTPKRLAGFLGFSAVIWSIDAVSATLVAAAFNFSISMALAFIILAALGLSSAIPSTPGYVGVYQFIAVAVMTPFGYSSSQILVFIIIWQLLSYVLMGFWGGVGFWHLGWKNKDLFQKANTES